MRRSVFIEIGIETPRVLRGSLEVAGVFELFRYIARVIMDLRMIITTPMIRVI